MDPWATPVTDVGELLLRRTAQQDSPNATLLGYKKYQKWIKSIKGWDVTVSDCACACIPVKIYQDVLDPHCQNATLGFFPIVCHLYNCCLDASDAYLSMKVSSKMGRYLKGFTQSVISSILEYLSGKSWTIRGPSSTKLIWGDNHPSSSMVQVVYIKMLMIMDTCKFWGSRSNFSVFSGT